MNRILPTVGARTAVMLAAMTLAAAPLAACAPEVEPPTNAGVCWHMVTQKGQPPKFYVVAKDQPDLEHCAARLEGMRIHFLSLGGGLHEVDGAYQGQFLFLNTEGVFTAPDLKQTPYLALVHSGDGRLVIPGAMPPSQ